MRFQFPSGYGPVYAHAKLRAIKHYEKNPFDTFMGFRSKPDPVVTFALYCQIYINEQFAQEISFWSLIW